MIENQHLNVMKRYFDESQKPLTFDIQYPRINPDTGELEYVLVQVPKIALVPMNSLKLKEMKLKFKVKLSSWDDGKSNDSGLLANILSSQALALALVYCRDLLVCPETEILLITVAGRQPHPRHHLAVD